MDKIVIGINAGKIWHLLDEKGGLFVAEIKDFLNLNDQDVLLALGWLARENKIECIVNEGNCVKVCLDQCPPEMYY